MAASPRTVAFTLSGQTFQIPEMWIVGRQRAHANLTPKEAYHAACLDWVVQERLAEQHARERTCPVANTHCPDCGNPFHYQPDDAPGVPSWCPDATKHTRDRARLCGLIRTAPRVRLSTPDGYYALSYQIERAMPETPGVWDAWTRTTTRRAYAVIQLGVSRTQQPQCHFRLVRHRAVRVITTEIVPEAPDA